jgi:hypothetical protein
MPRNRKRNNKRGLRGMRNGGMKINLGLIFQAAQQQLQDDEGNVELSLEVTLPQQDEMDTAVKPNINR